MNLPQFWLPVRIERILEHHISDDERGYEIAQPRSTRSSLHYTAINQLISLITSIIDFQVELRGAAEPHFRADGEGLGLGVGDDEEDVVGV